MTPACVRALLDDDEAWLACAFDGDQLAGYAIATRVELDDVGRVDWVAQLVVHSSYRHARVAPRLLYSIWQFSDCCAWGLVTANPFAVRALETAIRRPCRVAEIRRRGPAVLEGVAEHVPYLPAQLDVASDGSTLPSVNTGFFLDLSDLGSISSPPPARPKGSPRAFAR